MFLGRMVRFVAAISVIFGAALILGASAIAAPSWLAPEDHPEIDGTGEPRVAVDDAGSAYIVWEDSEDDAIYVTVRPAGGSWGPSRLLSVAAAGAFEPQIAAAGERAIAIWGRSHGGGNYSVEAAATLPSGEWESPKTLSGPAPGSISDLRVAIDAAGSAVATWDRSSGGEGRIEASYRPAGGAWGDPVFLSPAGQDARVPRVAIDDAGAAAAVWEQDDAGARRIVARRFVAGAWGQPVDLSEDGFDPDISAASDGTLIAVWDEGSAIVAAHRVPNSGEWVAVGPINEAATSEAYDAKVAMGDDGTAVATWWGHVPPEGVYAVRVAVKPAGAAEWQPPQRLSPLGDESVGERPDVAVDGQGNAIVVWGQMLEESAKRVYAARRPAGGSWGQAQPVSADAEEDAEEWQVAADGAGNAVAIWALDLSSPLVQTAAFDGAGPELRGLSIPETGKVGEQISFSVSPFDAFSGLGSTTWSFGDGASATGNGVAHSFAKPGEYPVTVRALDALGNESTSTGRVKITAAALPDVEPKAPPRMKARAQRLVLVRGGTAILKLRCPKAGPCRGLARLGVVVKRKGKRRQVVVGKQRIRMAAGARRNVRVKLNRAGKRLLRQAAKRNLPLKARLAGGGVKPRQVVLRKPRIAR